MKINILKFNLLFVMLRIWSDLGSIFKNFVLRLYNLFEVILSLVSCVCFRKFMWYICISWFILYVYWSFLKFRVWIFEDCKLWVILYMVLVVSILLNEMFKFFRCEFYVKVLIEIFLSVFWESEIFWSILYLENELLFNKISLLLDMFKNKRFLGRDCGMFENLFLVKLILMMLFGKYGVVFKFRLE